MFISVIVVIITSSKSGFITSAYALTSNDISDNNESFTKTPSSISILGSIDFTYPKLLPFLSYYHKFINYASKSSSNFFCPKFNFCWYQYFNRH